MIVPFLFGNKTKPVKYVSCERCKHVIHIHHAMRIQNILCRDEYKYFCPEHMINCHEYKIDMFTGKISFYRTVKVTEDGTPIGYKKTAK